MKKLVKAAYEDPENSVDLFDADLKNEFGEMYCVAPAILFSQVEKEWENYVNYRTEEPEAENHKDGKMKKFVSAAMAIANGLKPGDLFKNESGEIRRIVPEPGEYLTRGDFGDPIYSEVAMTWENNEWRLATEQEVKNGSVTWKVWDSVYGYLPQ